MISIDKPIFGLILLFAIACVVVNYYLLVNQDLETRDGDASLLNAVYFTTSNLTTTGYGDIVPKTGLGKVAVSIQHVMLIFIIFDIIVM